MKRLSKYNAKPQVVDGVRFDSKRELLRWLELKMMERVGSIRDLRRQVVFVLAPAVKIAGEKRSRPALRFTADFVYRDVYLDGHVGEKPVVEDAKGFPDTAFRIRQHLMKSVHGIDVRLS